MVQMDGSDHTWFEGCKERLVLMVIMDDATSRTYARFYRAETTAAAFDVFGHYTRKYGLPQALYVDRDSIYRSDRQGRIDEELRDQGPLTQFGRAMKSLGVELILANSPQAKGRVERRNGVFQDRLVKELRLRKVSTLEAANVYLEKEFLPEMNRRFVVRARERGDVHQPVPAGLRLKDVLCWEETRRVQNDWTIRWRNRWFQVGRQHEGLDLAGREVVVRERLDGTVSLLWRGHGLAYQELPERPVPRKPEPKAVCGVRNDWKPTNHHPWNRTGVLAMAQREARARTSATATPSLTCAREEGTLLSSPARGHF
jgi:hypothetical protein